MTREALPARAIANLAEKLGIEDSSLISDIKTTRVGETYYLTVTLTREISQAELIGLTK